MKRLTLFVISLYQRTISLDHGPLNVFFPDGYSVICRYHPTCSEYTKHAVVKYGVGKGLQLGILRILRCHPWSHQPIHDPVR